MMEKPRLLLWDVDGTLVSNHENEELLFGRMIRSVLPDLVEVVHPYRHGKTDLQQAIEYLQLNGGAADAASLAGACLVEVSRAHFATAGRAHGPAGGGRDPDRARRRRPRERVAGHAG